MPKVKALAEQVRRINKDAQVTCVVADFCALTDSEIDFHVGSTNLIIAATDHFPAQARVNEWAVSRGIPALWIGLYARAGAGEIIGWHPGIDSCFRCVAAKRYAAHEAAKREGRSVDPPSDGADIFSIQLVDAIAGQKAIGLLTRGADNRFGRLIDMLGTGADARNFIQVKIDPNYTFGGRDIFREQLKIPQECDAYFAWNAIARRDNPLVAAGCRDCAIYRGHYWVPMGHCGLSIRMKPGDPGYDEAEACSIPRRTVFLPWRGVKAWNHFSSAAPLASASGGWVGDPA